MCAPSDEVSAWVVSVILGQPTNCALLHIGESFFTDSSMVSNELVLLSVSKINSNHEFN